MRSLCLELRLGFAGECVCVWAPSLLVVFIIPFKLGKPFVRQPRGDTRVTPEDKQRLAEQRAAEIAKRRADFNATNN